MGLGEPTKFEIRVHHLYHTQVPPKFVIVSL